MIRISRDPDPRNASELADILCEYLTWNRDEMPRLGLPDFDPAMMVAQTLDNLSAYLPPNGHLLTARSGDGTLVGVGFLKRIRPDTAEIKRLYIRPTARGTGLGRRMVNDLLDLARDMACTHVLIDTGSHMTAAQALYRSFGFTTIKPYPESENDPSWATFLAYMQLDL